MERSNVGQFCPNCGRPTSVSDRFCPGCGCKIEGRTVPRPVQSIPRQQRPPDGVMAPEYAAYRENIEFIGRVIAYYRDVEAQMGREGAALIRQSFDLMRQQMDRSASLPGTQTVSCSRQEVELVIAVCRNLLKTMINERLTKLRKDLCSSMAILIHNWNKAIAKCPELEVLVSSLNRIVRDQSSMEDTTMILRSLVLRARDVLRYTPASFELSKHYLLSLEEDANEP